MTDITILLNGSDITDIACIIFGMIIGIPIAIIMAQHDIIHRLRIHRLK
jgi:hypothetical protein